MQVFLGVVFRRRVPAALVGDDMHDDGAIGVCGGVAQRRFHCCDVVTVDRAEVSHTERFEERRGLPHLSHRGCGAFDAPSHAVAQWHFVQQLIHGPASLHIVRRLAHSGHRRRQPTDRGGIGASVVVEHDECALGVMAEVVERFEGHAAGHGAVADDGHHTAVLVAGQREPCSEA